MARPRTTLTLNAIVWHEWRKGGEATQKPPFSQARGSSRSWIRGSPSRVSHHSLLLPCDSSFLLHQTLHSDSTQPPQALMTHHAWTFSTVLSSCGGRLPYKVQNFIGAPVCWGVGMLELKLKQDAWNLWLQGVRKNLG
jgi:hypothetical protein